MLCPAIAIAYISCKLMDKYTYTRKSDVERHIRRARKEERYRQRQARATTKGKGKARRDVEDVFGPTTHGGQDEEQANSDSSDGDADNDFDPPGSDDEDYAYEVAEFEVNLKHWIECLNIHGNAGVAASYSTNSGYSADGEGGSAGGGGRRGKKQWIMDDDDVGGGRGFGSTGGGREKDFRNTSLIMTWQGEGEPLTMLL